MYDTDRSGRNRDTSLWHHGDWRRTYRHHLDECWEVHNGTGDRSQLLSRLKGRICSGRIIRYALAQTASRPSAAGPDGATVESVIRDPWPWCNDIAKRLKVDRYHPGGTREVQVPKPNGARRVIQIPNLADRVVAKAAVLILQPLLDPLFAPTSFGFRPRRGVLDALGAIRHAIVTSGNIVVTADIRTAFDVVPTRTLARIAEERFGPDAARLAMLVAAPNRNVGLLQGSPLSPFLFNCFADAEIDACWRKREGEQALFRYADDLAFVTNSTGQAEALKAKLEAICSAAGTPVKTPVVANLAKGETAEWLGFNIGLNAGQVTFDVALKRWEKLKMQLQLCHELTTGSAAKLAAKRVDGWLFSAGACKESVDIDRMFAAVNLMMRECSFDVLRVEQLTAWLDSGWEQAARLFELAERDREPEPKILQTPEPADQKGEDLAWYEDDVPF